MFWAVSDTTVFWAVSDTTAFWAVSDTSLFWAVSDTTVFWAVSDTTVFWAVSDTTAKLEKHKIIKYSKWLHLRLFLNYDSNLDAHSIFFINRFIFVRYMVVTKKQQKTDKIVLSDLASPF